MGKPRCKSIGYVRLSTSGEAAVAQVSDLKEEGCSIVFQEISAARGKEPRRPQLMAALAALGKGDEVVVSRMDHLGGTQIEIINLIYDLQQQGIQIRTLDKLMNTKGLGKFGPVLIGLLSGLAEVDHLLIRERTLERIQYRKENGGNVGGRPKTNAAKEGLVMRLRNEGDSYRAIRTKTGLALSTIRRIIVEKEALNL